jgi:hypothetical protein
MVMIETELGVARRHIREGQTRINNQRALIDRLISRGHGHMLPQARLLLTTMQTTQDLAEAHLASLERLP